MKHVCVIGAGPAGLMAAEVLASAGVAVMVFDAMPSAGRKFLLAGKGGLNLTHSEPADIFVTRYGQRRRQMAAMLEAFNADSVRAWALSLGVETFVGSSGRVFPRDMKAAPLLRAWLRRLRQPSNAPAVQLLMRHRWRGWSSAASALTELHFDTPSGALQTQADAVVLALGGGSWARLGSDGAWLTWLRQFGVATKALRPANCGFDVQGGWSEHFASRFAGAALKSVAIRFTDIQGACFQRRGEFVATATGVEGSLIYAASSWLRDEIEACGQATFYLDLLPQRSPDWVLAQTTYPRGARSLSNHLKSRLHIDGVKAALLYELLSKEQLHDPAILAQNIKALPITLQAARPLDEAISSAGGVCFEALTLDLMLQAIPGVFCAGEMLDWEAPTGGYLITACLASGVAAAQGVLRFLAHVPKAAPVAVPSSKSAPSQTHLA